MGETIAITVYKTDAKLWSFQKLKKHFLCTSSSGVDGKTGQTKTYWWDKNEAEEQMKKTNVYAEI